MYRTVSLSLVQRRLYRAGVCILMVPNSSSVSLEAMSHPSHLCPQVSNTALTLVRCEPEWVIMKHMILSESLGLWGCDETIIVSIIERLESTSSSQIRGGLCERMISFLAWSVSMETLFLELKRAVKNIDRQKMDESPTSPRYETTDDCRIASVSSWWLDVGLTGDLVF